MSAENKVYIVSVDEIHYCLDDKPQRFRRIIKSSAGITPNFLNEARKYNTEQIKKDAENKANGNYESNYLGTFIEKAGAPALPSNIKFALTQGQSQQYHWDYIEGKISQDVTPMRYAASRMEENDPLF